MGSNQSTTGSFSIDSSGNIVHTPTGSHRDQVDNSGNQRSTGGEAADIQATDEPHQQAGATSPYTDAEPSTNVMTTANSSQQAGRNDGSGDLSLQEADEIVSRLKSKHKDNSKEMSGKHRSVFEGVEGNLVQCYAVNKNQPLNCSKQLDEYKDYVRGQRSQLLKNSTTNIPLVTSILVIITCLLLHMAAPVTCFGAMSIDLGSEWMKVGLVAPSVPMDIVLNAQSQRKTPMAIAFSNGERFIGDTALDVASKYPERAYTHFLDLVGKSIDDESVKHYKQRFPYADIKSHQPNSTSIVLNHPEGLQFTPLELIAMMMQHAHDQVTNRLNSNEPAYEVVITVPPFFNSKERRVIVDAARLAGLNVLRLTNVNSAFALSYGIFRHQDYLPESKENTTSIVFIDQGASHTSATLADYHLVEQVDETTGMSKNESLPTVTIRAQVYDRFLGGFDMQLKLRDYLVRAFSKETKIDESRIFKRGRSFAKLLKESAKVKKILSANNQHEVRVENVIDDRDLRHRITRQQYEELNAEYLEMRIKKLLDSLFEMPGVDRNDLRLESVTIVGGNTRTPKIQQVLLDYFKLDNLGKSINADEGAALAALYQAASLGRGFRVKKFVLEEFGEERKRYDPARAAELAAARAAEAATSTTTTTTTTTTESPTTAEPTLEQIAESLNESSIAEQPATEPVISITTESPPTPLTTDAARETVAEEPSMYSESELDRIASKLAYLREQDFHRLQRLSLLNSLESMISEGGGDNPELQQLLNETHAWLENGPLDETSNVTLIAEKVDAINNFPREAPKPPHVEL